ncbi:MAG TPA: hypothetical protein VLC52_16835 [Anaerolineae bacterium]|nr:hypothetical protein [Anaerolineae bacterium]
MRRLLTEIAYTWPGTRSLEAGLPDCSRVEPEAFQPAPGVLAPAGES